MIFGATWQKIWRDWILSFDGTDDHILGDDYPSLRITGDMTVVAWVKPDVTANTFMPVVQKDYYREWCLVVDVRGTSRNLAWRHGDGEVEIINFVNYFTEGSVWYHVAVVRVGKNIVAYKNGTYFGTQSFTKTIVSGTSPLMLGRATIAGYWYRGLIGDVLVFRKALSAEQISFLYNLFRGELRKPP